METIQPDKGFGAVFERYSWSQTINDVTVTIAVAANIRAKNVVCIIESNHLHVSIKGESLPILDGNTFQRVKVDNSVWTLEGEGSNRILRIDLDKNEGEHWWPYVIEGEQSIDVSKIDPAPVNLDSLDGSLRTQVEKMMYDQSQKEKGMPTSDEKNKAETINNFMKQHPEMDFSDAVIN